MGYTNPETGLSHFQGWCSAAAKVATGLTPSPPLCHPDPALAGEGSAFARLLRVCPACGLYSNAENGLKACPDGGIAWAIGKGQALHAASQLKLQPLQHSTGLLF